MLHQRVYLVLIFGYISNCQNYFFTANRHSEYRCVTNSSFALSWVDEDVNKAFNEVSRFIPQKAGRDFDCKISNDTRTFMYYLRDPWKLKRSHDELILDHRWEEMNVVPTDPDTFTGEALHFKQILSNLENNFQVPFSIRTDKEAHIFLCDGPQPPTSNCYWLMLQAFNGTESAIRKCAKNSIPATNAYFAQEPCSTKLSKIQHPQFPPYLSNKFWTHFQISKRDNNLSLVTIEEKTKKIIVELADRSQIFNVTHLVVYSRHTNALWRFHSLNYIHTNQQTQEINLGPSIKPSEGLVCVSMFVSMCKSCKLKLSITSADGVLGEKIFRPNQPMGWSQIRFIVENVTSDKCRLLVSTIGLSFDHFWAIDSVRQCELNESRMISLNRRSSCQLLSGESNVISPHGRLETFENRCPEDTIGESCVPCHWVFDKCHQTKICSKYRCFCSAGFNYTECLYACNPGYYGHGCQKKCQNCATICDSVNGTCSSCSSNYSGPRCEFAPATIFKRAPIVFSVNDTKARINVTNFEVLNGTKDDHPLSFSIEIKESDNDNQVWTTVGRNFPFYLNQSFNIIFLKADTTYFVRTVITTSKKKVFSDTRIPFATFTTKCQEISEDNIKVIPTNTSANVSLEQEKDPKICKINKYQVKIGKLSLVTLSKENFVLFRNLTPFTNYTVEIQRGSKKYQKVFQTLEGEPEKIQNLRTDNVSSSSCSLTWQKPSRFNGKFQFYTMEIHHQSHLACDFQPNNSLPWNVIRVQRNTATLNNLVPFSKYLLEIYAVNIRFSGQKVILTVSTKPSDMIHQEEIPNVEKILPETHTAEVILSQVECTQMRGPLLIKATATCKSKWCANFTSVHYSDQITRLKLRFLKPFTHYHLQMEFCRNVKNCRSNKTIGANFTTKPAAPAKVRNVSVFSKSESSIWIRWQPPDPPNGILKNYKLLVSHYNNLLRRRYEELVFINSTKCKLWPSYHCATLNNLKNGTHYTVSLTGRNEEPASYGESVSIATTTRIEPSEAPSDLGISWTFDNNLKLEWKHPKISNGQIKHFKISILALAYGIIIEKKLLVTEDTYNTTYYYTVPIKNLLIPATVYDIKISAFNGFEGKELVKNDTSPPKAPALVQEPLFSSSDRTIKVEIFLEHLQEEEKCKYQLFLKISEETVAKCIITNFVNFSVIIGNEKQPLVNSCDQKIKNPPLRSGTSYNITIQLKNSFNNKTREKIYSFTYHTSGLSELQQYYLFASLIFLLIILIPILGFRFLSSRKRKRLVETEIELQNQTPLVTFKKPKNEKIETFSKAIKVSKFEIYVKESEGNREFEHQHSMILKNPSRTIYETTEGSHYFDYIDLQFVNGSKLPKVYIASEVPQKAQAISDFWKTLWEENVKHVILDGDIKNQKTFQYWPEIDSKMHCHNLTVELMFSKNFETYEYRKFVLVHDDEIRHIEHIQNIYLGLNAKKFVALFKRMLKLPLDSSSPIFVHSYNGLSRTGFILLCDMCLRMAERENIIDVFKNFNRLSNYRVELVDDLEYYKLAHRIVSACLLPGKFEDQSTNFYVNF